MRRLKESTKLVITLAVLGGYTYWFWAVYVPARSCL